MCHDTRVTSSYVSYSSISQGNEYHDTYELTYISSMTHVNQTYTSDIYD